MVKLVILTGPSGSGKTLAQYVFEESGYYVIDNILPSSFTATIEEMIAHPDDYPKVLLIASPQNAKEIIRIGKDHYKDKVDSKIIVLDCKIATLLGRFKLTRHVHPMTTRKNVSLEDALEQDIDNINEIKESADLVIDTTALEVKDFRRILFEAILNRKKDTVKVRFMSFGHKFNTPMDCDLIFDTRALPNPYWVPELRNLTGLDKKVIEYLNSFEETKDLIKRISDYLDFYLAKVQEDGRGDYCVGVCCSGGQHRSVYVAEKLAEHFNKKYDTYVFHRDINKRVGA